MGLDMYCCACDSEEIFAAIENGSMGFWDASKEFFYWRKHPDLHGWMENLYRAKGGSESMFNGVPVRLRSVDLDILEDHVKRGVLPKTRGFFFGESQGDEWERDLEFIKLAHEYIEDGKVIFYTSSW